MLLVVPIHPEPDNPPLELGPVIFYQGRQYRQVSNYDNVWFCYHSEEHAVGKFKHFLIARADSNPGTEGPRIQNPLEGDSLRSGYGSVPTVHLKLLGLLRGKSRSMIYRPRSVEAAQSRAESTDQILTDLRNRSLDEIFQWLEG